MCNDQLIIAYTFLMLLGAPQIHNEYFCHNEPHNDAPSVSVRPRRPRPRRERPRTPRPQKTRRGVPPCKVHLTRSLPALTLGLKLTPPSLSGARSPGSIPARAHSCSALQRERGAAIGGQAGVRHRCLHVSTPLGSRTRRSRWRRPTQRRRRRRRRPLG